MSVQAPFILVADASNDNLAAALRVKDRAPVIECTWAKAAKTIEKSWPAAVVFDEPVTEERAKYIDGITTALAQRPEPYLPIVARVVADFPTVTPTALPISVSATPERIAARVFSALRVRTLHTTLFNRTESVRAAGVDLPEMSGGDPLDDATVLVTGRGRTYPELATVVGERVGMIGSLSVESAARYLNSRDLNGIFIGEGYGPPTVNAFLTALGEDARFRDIPIALLGGVPVSADLSRLPNFERFDARPADAVKWMWPLVRLHAYEAQLQRQLTAVEARGMLDPKSGLFTTIVFLDELSRAVKAPRHRKPNFSVARFTFPREVDARITLDAARQVSRLIRSVDFACQASDGSILFACPETELRSAHVLARRIASALKSTILTSDRKDGRIEPMIALAALKPNDTVESLLSRVSEPAQLAAE
ncbi:MAG TPA: GGDEF domain-containing protein [Xanthobacteraceae bacterium]|jgi:GGDEF domain-containing protein|nr:GGDEF domain-containing protein [Xanthobacteraceae bacterium]